MESKAKLNIGSTTMTADQITSALGVNADVSWSAGEIDPRTNRAHVESRWGYRAKGGDDTFESHIEDILKFADSHEDQLRSLASSCSFNIYCMVVTEGGQAGVVVTPAIAARLSRHGIWLILDIHGDEQ